MVYICVRDSSFCLLGYLCLFQGVKIVYGITACKKIKGSIQRRPPPLCPLLLSNSNILYWHNWSKTFTASYRRSVSLPLLLSLSPPPCISVPLSLDPLQKKIKNPLRISSISALRADLRNVVIIFYLPSSLGRPPNAARPLPPR